MDAGLSRASFLSRLNVIFMGNFLYPRGMAATKRVQLFVDGVMAEEGSSARLVLLRQSHCGRDKGKLAGVHNGVPYLTIGSDMPSGWRFPMALIAYFAMGIRQLRVNRQASANNILFVYNEPNLESAVFVLAARLLGYKVIVDVVEDAYAIAEDAPLASRLKAASAGFATKKIRWFADSVVVISGYLQKKYESIVDEGLPVTLIPISVDLQRVSSVRNSPDGPVRILYAGSFAAKDDVEGLITAVERVADRHSGVELHLTGQGMADRTRWLHERIQRSPHRQKLHYHGLLPDDQYFDQLARCDVACMVRTASDFADRGFPFKLGEYLATARPVIASRVGDVEIYLQDGHSAFLVEPGSTDAIEAALERVLADPSRALAVGAKGRLVAECNFDSRVNGRKLVDVAAALA